MARRSHQIEIELTPDLFVVDPFGLWITETGQGSFEILPFLQEELQSLDDE